MFSSHRSHERFLFEAQGPRQADPDTHAPQANGTNGSTGLGARYGTPPDRPLWAYVTLTTAYLTATGTALAILARRGRLRALRVDEIALSALAAQRLSRRVTKDVVTSPLRAPFTERGARTGPSELSDRPRGSGLQKVIGELLTCPFCLTQWTSTAIVLGFLGAPRPTRTLATIFTVIGAADTAQLAYGWLEGKAG